MMIGERERDKSEGKKEGEERQWMAEKRKR